MTKNKLVDDIPRYIQYIPILYPSYTHDIPITYGVRAAAAFP